MANENIGQIGLDATDIRCEECNHVSYSQDDYCPHLRLKQSADDQVLISSLLALAGEPPAPYAVSMIYKKQFVKLFSWLFKIKHQNNCFNCLVNFYRLSFY